MTILSSSILVLSTLAICGARPPNSEAKDIIWEVLKESEINPHTFPTKRTTQHPISTPTTITAPTNPYRKNTTPYPYTAMTKTTTTPTTPYLNTTTSTTTTSPTTPYPNTTTTTPTTTPTTPYPYTTEPPPTTSTTTPSPPPPYTTTTTGAPPLKLVKKKVITIEDWEADSEL